MDKENIILKIWLFATIMICSFYVCQLFYNFVRKFQAGILEINFDSGRLVQVVIMASTYYITKFILLGEKKEEK